MWEEVERDKWRGKRKERKMETCKGSQEGEKGIEEKQGYRQNRDGDEQESSEKRGRWVKNRGVWNQFRWAGGMHIRGEERTTETGQVGRGGRLMSDCEGQQEANRERRMQNRKATRKSNWRGERGEKRILVSEEQRGRLKGMKGEKKLIIL